MRNFRKNIGSSKLNYVIVTLQKSFGERFDVFGDSEEDLQLYLNIKFYFLKIEIFTLKKKFSWLKWTSSNFSKSKCDEKVFDKHLEMFFMIKSTSFHVEDLIPTKTHLQNKYRKCQISRKMTFLWSCKITPNSIFY